MKHYKLIITLSILSVLLITGDVKAKDAEVAVGKKVTMDYITKINGQVVDTTIGKKPITFVMGDGTLIPGVAQKLEGLKAGEMKVINLTAEEGFGQVYEEAIHEFEASAFPEGTKFKQGSIIEVDGPEGSKVSGFVSESNDEKVIVDFNHPFAGKDLEIEVKIVSVQ